MQKNGGKKQKVSGVWPGRGARVRGRLKEDIFFSFISWFSPSIKKSVALALWTFFSIGYVILIYIKRALRLSFSILPEIFLFIILYSYSFVYQSSLSLELYVEALNVIVYAKSFCYIYYAENQEQGFGPVT